jgi:hypothetical protein
MNQKLKKIYKENDKNIKIFFFIKFYILVTYFIQMSLYKNS